MLRLLRRIRQSLLGSGQTSRYILYAIGEIALVVIGILIALQINNWNESKKLHHTQKVYLKEIRNDLVQDTALLSHVIKQHKRRLARMMVLDSTIHYVFGEIIGSLPQVEPVTRIEYIFLT